MTLYDKISFACVCIIGYKVITNVKIMALYLFSNKIPDLSCYGTWAVVTGGTDGIGRAFCNELASQGINIILVGYVQEEQSLEDTAVEIRIMYCVQTKYLARNLYQAQGVYSRLEKELKAYDIGVLVNAFGIKIPRPDFFIDMEQAERSQGRNLNNISYTEYITSNLYPVTHLCRIILKGMYERKRGIIINISSPHSEIPSPMLAVYGATKAYISKFSKDLSIEYRRHGIIVQCLQPGIVTNNPKPFLSWLHPSPENYVRSALRTLGLKDQTCGFVPHCVFLATFMIMTTLLPQNTRDLMVSALHMTRERILTRR